MRLKKEIDSNTNLATTTTALNPKINSLKNKILMMITAVYAPTHTLSVLGAPEIKQCTHL